MPFEPSALNWNICATKTRLVPTTTWDCRSNSTGANSLYCVTQTGRLKRFERTIAVARVGSYLKLLEASADALRCAENQPMTDVSPLPDYGVGRRPASIAEMTPPSIKR